MHEHNFKIIFIFLLSSNVTVIPVFEKKKKNNLLQVTYDNNLLLNTYEASAYTIRLQMHPQCHICSKA